MQNKKVDEFVLISVPKEVLEDAGIVDGSVLQIYADGNRLVIERLTDTGEVVCDGDCDNCPVNETECDGNCEECPCYKNCEEEEKGKRSEYSENAEELPCRMKSGARSGLSKTTCCRSRKARTADR